MNGPRSWERRNHRRRSSCANFIASVIVGSGIVLPKAWIALRRGRLDMNVLSTPVSFVAALACAARQGVLVKGAGYLEVASRLKAIALDKTGTLTVGRPEAKAVVAWSGHTKREVVEIAAAIDARSQHPLAEAIVRHAESLGLRPQPADDFQSVPGKGATAVLAGQPLWIGSHRAFEERGQETPELHDRLEQLAASGHSVVILANNEHTSAA